MTIDEAIQRENKIAEENQKIVDTEIVFDDVSLSQLYCDDTKVIEEHLENYKKCAEYHKKLAEWLEELKFLRQWKSDVMDEFCKYDCNSVEEAWHNAYNKALYDFKEILTIEKIKEYAESDGFINLNNCSLMIFDIAEQLKVGVENE